jgi:hypothetical protein
MGLSLVKKNFVASLICLSGVSYIGMYFLFLPAPDFRYAYWAIFAQSLSSFLLLVPAKQGCEEGRSSLTSTGGQTAHRNLCPRGGKSSSHVSAARGRACPRLSRQELGNRLRIGKQMEVRTKGIEHPVVLFEALGIGGRHKLSFPEAVDTLIELKDEIPLRYEVVESSLGGAMSKGGLTKVSCKGAEGGLEGPVPALSNLKMHLIGSGGEQLPGALHG